MAVNSVNDVKGVNSVKMPERLSDQLLAYLQTTIGREVNLKDIRTFLQIEPGSKDDQNLRVQMSTTLTNKRVVKPSGKNDGIYKVLRPIRRITSLGSAETKPIDIVFPYGIDDASSFGFEDLLETDEGDCHVIAGVSNSAKTLWVITMLAMNMDKFPCVLMGNEYNRVDGKLSPKFVRRLQRMNWAGWEKENGQLKFDILPVNEDYDTWVEPGKINFIDWINIGEDFYKVGKIIEGIKSAVGNGMSVVVLQKNIDKQLGRGGAPTIDLADFYISLDPMGSYERRLTVIKAKAQKGFLDGRMWGFKVVDGGTKLHGIREIKKCTNCWGKGYTLKGKCEDCNETGYVDK